MPGKMGSSVVQSISLQVILKAHFLGDTKENHFDRLNWAALFSSLVSPASFSHIPEVRGAPGSSGLLWFTHLEFKQRSQNTCLIQSLMIL